MKYQEKFNLYRFISLSIICLASIITLAIMCVAKQLYPDEWFCLIVVDLLFLAVFIFELEHERVIGRLYNHTETNFSRACLGFVLACGIGLFGMIFPEYYKPVMFISMIMYGFSNEMIAISCGMYFSVLFCLLEGKNMNELAGYVFLILISTVFYKALSKKETRFFISILYFCFQLLIPSVLYYWNYRIISYEVYIWGIGMGAIAFLFTLLLMGNLRKKVKEEANEKYQELLQDEYSEVREVRAFSVKEYEHARKVSKLAAICGRECGLDVKLCEAAGFYYRMGKRLGEPFVENGVLHARQL